MSSLSSVGQAWIVQRKADEGRRVNTTAAAAAANHQTEEETAV